MAPRWTAASLLVLLGAAVASVEASTLSIAASPITTPTSDGLQQELTVEKTWTIASDDLEAELHRLDVQVAGNVRVELDESLATAAAVTVRSSSSDLLELMDVAVIDTDAGSNVGSGDGVRVHYKNQHAHVVALVETRVLVRQRNLLSTVRAMYAQNVVLAPDVVARDAADAELFLSAMGNTVLFVEGDEPFSLQKLTAHISGDGGVQVTGKTIQVADEISLSVAGTGRVAVVADSVVARDVASAIAGDGKTWVQTTNGFKTTTLHTSIVGAGTATFAPAGTCSSQTISIAGSGSAFTGGVKCGDADVSIVGDGHAMVQASNSLTTSTILTSTVKYVGPKPKKVETHGISMHGEAFATVSHAERDSFPVYEPLTAPPSSMIVTTVNLLVESATNADAPYVRVTPFADAAIRLGSVSTLLSPGVGALVLFEFAVVALALAAFSIMRFRQRRIREEYMALP